MEWHTRRDTSALARNSGGSGTGRSRDPVFTFLASMLMRQILRLLSAALVLGSAARADAQLPTVQQVYDKFAAAVGGVDAWRPMTGRTETGTANVSFAGISGSYERRYALPNKTRLILDLGMVRIDQGFDGEKGWIDQGQGPMPMPADQVKSMAEASPDGAHFLNPARFASATVAGRETFDGVDAYKLDITFKTGEHASEYFDVASGLRIGTVTKTPAGEQTAVYKAYKEFDGKKLPTTVIQRNGQGDIVITITAVTFGAPTGDAFKSPQ